MSDSTKQNLKIYGAHAGQLAQSYNTVSTPDVIPAFAHVLLEYKNPGDLTVLDIGCGTGRDAQWMAEHGFNVVAIDGSNDMLSQARDHKNHPRIHYMQDMAPILNNTRALNQKFDIVLMSAFLFHLDKSERQDLYQNLIELCNHGAYIYTILRHGPVPEGRRMFEVHAEELNQFATDHHIDFTNLGSSEDALGRTEVSWDHIELRLPTPRPLF